MNEICFAVDIGGTKIAVLAGKKQERSIEILERLSFDTIKTEVEQNLENIITLLRQLCETHGQPSSIGISCGGPLDSKAGLILSPPNLPLWDRIPIVERLLQEFRVPVAIENDADACALAEHEYGAGYGCDNMIFLTFGTGLGAGLILNGALYRGATNCAGEVGHVRMRPDGPIGYYKAGSLEGFCSGGGLNQLGRQLIREHIINGTATDWARKNRDNNALSAKDIATAAYDGDAIAIEIMACCGEIFGEGLSILIDILNPERIVVGSIFARCGDLLVPSMQEAMRREALALNASVCSVVPAKLGEQLGDYAALSVAFRQIK